MTAKYFGHLFVSICTCKTFLCGAFTNTDHTSHQQLNIILPSEKGEKKYLNKYIGKYIYLLYFYVLAIKKEKEKQLERINKK